MTEQKYHHNQPESRVKTKFDVMRESSRGKVFDSLTNYQQMNVRYDENMSDKQMQDAIEAKAEDVERERESTRFAYHIQKENPEMSNREARRLARREYAYTQGKEYHPRFKSRRD